MRVIRKQLQRVFRCFTLISLRVSSHNGTSRFREFHGRVLHNHLWLSTTWHCQRLNAENDFIYIRKMRPFLKTPKAYRYICPSSRLGCCHSELGLIIAAGGCCSLET